MPVNGNRPSAPAWTGYGFAVIVTAGVFLFRLAADQLIGDRISLPLCGLAAVIACIWRAGIGPAVAASALTTAWYIRELWGVGTGGYLAWIHCAIYLIDAGAVCIYGRQLRVARDEAAQGEDWQRHLVETAGEGIWLVDPEGLIVYANPRIAEILGYGVDRIQGSKTEAFLFPEDLPAERIRFLTRRAGVKEQFDRRLRRTDGSEVWTLACSSPYAYQGKDAGVLTMMTDITERKKAEQALRRSERRYRELFENVREGVYQTSPDGRILAANPELLRMLGFSSQEELNVVGVVRDTFVDPGLHQSLRDRLDRDGSYASVEFQLRTRDHRIVTVRENARVVRDENGQVLCYEGTLTDITEKLRFEKQLRQAQQMEALGRLAGGIARDFRSIGAGMRSGLSRVLDTLPADHPARPRLEAITGSMQSAEALTRQILDFSQRQAGAREGYPANDAVINLNALIVRLEPELIRLAYPEASLVFSLCQARLPVFADRGHMQQIVTSFVIHAREFGAGKKRIGLSTTIAPAGSGEARGPMVCLSVRSRSDSGDGEEDGNPWLGMATTQAILEQYGGTMTASVDPAAAESERSVRYELFLPLVAGSDTSPIPAEAAGTSNTGQTAATVLLVEEEPLIRELSRDMLERQGFRVLTAGNAVEAERTARGQEVFDVLIVAWEMGGRRGNAFIQLMHDMRPGLRVLFVAGYSDGTADSAPLPEGSDILRKPFSAESLGRKIRLLLESAEGRSA